MNFASTDLAAALIIHVIEDEGQRLSAVLHLERHEKKEKANELVISLKKGGNTFRITFSWVRDQNISEHGFLLGNGYIEKEWDLRLRPTRQEFPLSPPFVWELHPHGPSKLSEVQVLSESWLRQLIQKKLAVEGGV